MKWLVILLLCLPLVSANYVTGEIRLDENGVADFSLESDIPIEGLSYEEGIVFGETEMFSSKQGGVWNFALDLGYFDDAQLDIYLPSNVESITSLEGTQTSLNLEEKVVYVFGKDESVDVLISYTTLEKKNYFAYIVSLTALILVVCVIFYYKSQFRKQKFKHIMPIVVEKEEAIIKALMKGPKRHKSLQEELRIPKASFSRYVVHLEEKGVIKREGEGRNKLLSLKK